MALGIDSLGNGMLFAFQVLFLTVVVGLTLAQAGIALTVAQFAALPTPVLAGRLVDRVGPKFGSVFGDVLCAVGYSGLLVADSLWMSTVSLSLIQIGISTYWTANGPLIALVAPAEQRVRWFAAVQAVRNAGIGIGGALAALAVAWSQRDGLRLLVLIDVFTYVLAAVLVLTWRTPASRLPTAHAGQGARGVDEEIDSNSVLARAAGVGPAVRGGYRTVLRDRTFLWFLAVNLVFVLAALAPSLLIAVYLTEVLDHHSWLAGALLTLNTVMIVTLQTSVGRRIESLSTGRILTAATALNAVAFLVFAAVGLLSVPVMTAGLVLAMVVLTFAEMLSAPVTGALAVSLAPETLRGRYQALVQLTWTLGGILAPALLIGLQVKGYLPWLALTVLSLLTVLLTASCDPKHAGKRPGADMPPQSAARAVAQPHPE